MNQIINLTDKKELIYASFLLHKNGLEPVGDPTFDQWLDCGGFIRSAGRSVHFWIGDWLNYGENNWPDKYQEAIEKTGFDYGTLRNDKWIAARVPSHIRKVELSFDHHQTVADSNLETEEMEKLLQEAVDKKISSSSFRKYVARIESIFKTKPQEKREIQLSMVKESFDWFYRITRLNRELAKVLDECPQLYLTVKENDKLQTELNQTIEKIKLFFNKISI